MWEFEWIEKGKDFAVSKSKTVPVDEKADMIGYLNEGLSGGWIKSYNYMYIKEEY